MFWCVIFERFSAFERALGGRQDAHLGAEGLGRTVSLVHPVAAEARAFGDSVYDKGYFILFWCEGGYLVFPLES